MTGRGGHRRGLSKADEIPEFILPRVTRPGRRPHAGLQRADGVFKPSILPILPNICAQTYTLRISGVWVANSLAPWGYIRSDCIPSVRNLRFATPSVRRWEARGRAQAIPGHREDPPKLLLPCDGVIFGGSWGDQSYIKLAPRVCVSLESQVASGIGRGVRPAIPSVDWVRPCFCRWTIQGER